MLRYTVRMLLRNLGFTIAALVCLALGIGATSAIFSIVNAVLLRPLPYPNAHRLVQVYTEFPTFPHGGLHKFTVSEPEVFVLQRCRAFDAIGAWFTTGSNIAGLRRPIRVTTTFVSAPVFPMLGVRPLLGRTFFPDEDVPKGRPTVVLSYKLWQRAFAGDPTIVGRDTYLNSAKAKVIGVMPEGFVFPPGSSDETEAWSALQLDPHSTNYGGHNFNVLARLAPGVSLTQARIDMGRLVADAGLASSPMNHVLNPRTHPVTIYSYHDEVVGDVRKPMLMLMGAVLFVLLIACVNVANLLLARGEARRRETAIRCAVGASTGQLLKQFIFEGTFLAVLGAGIGLIIANWSIQVVRQLSSGTVPRANEITLDWNVLAFTLTVALLTGVVFGLTPVLHFSAAGVYETLSAGARSSSDVSSGRFRHSLVAVQVSLAFLLVVGAGLMVHSFWMLQRVNPGFNPDKLLTFSLNLPKTTYSTAQSCQDFWARLGDRIRQIPGVTSATLMSGLPPVRHADDDDTDIENFVRVPGGPIENVTYYQIVDEQFFHTLGARIVQGRALERRDFSKLTPGVVVNQAMALTFWPHQSPIGRRVRPGVPGAPWLTVVGVVADLKNAGLSKATETELFVPYRFAPFPELISQVYVAVKSTSDPMALLPQLHDVLGSLDPSLPIAEVRTMDEVIAAASSRPRFLTVILSLFSAVAIGLAALGIYGVISYSVAQRHVEFGIRLALGARPASMLWGVIVRGLLLGAAGVCCGAIAALLLMRSLQGLLFGVSYLDLSSFTGTAVLIIAVVTAACAFPAYRAMRIQPVQALRYE